MSNGSTPFKKIATMPIYVKKKTFKRNLLQNQGNFETEILLYSIADSRSTKFVQMMILGWPSTFYKKVCLRLYTNFWKIIFQNRIKN